VLGQTAPTSRGFCRKRFKNSRPRPVAVVVVIQATCITKV
jgi:hypothetical protein